MSKKIPLYDSKNNLVDMATFDKADKLIQDKRAVAKRENGQTILQLVPRAENYYKALTQVNKETAERYIRENAFRCHAPHHRTIPRDHAGRWLKKDQLYPDFGDDYSEESSPDDVPIDIMDYLQLVFRHLNN